MARSTEELIFKVYLLSINLNVNSPMWLVATTLSRVVVETKADCQGCNPGYIIYRMWDNSLNLSVPQSRHL